MKQLIAGNWKMNSTRAQTLSLLDRLKNELPESDQAQWAVFPPFVYLELAHKQLAGSSVAWGAQNVSAFQTGAYTGEVSVDMLQDLGCHYVIVGHSERRQLFFEDEQVLARKVEQAIAKAITPIVCVGESYEQYQNGQTETVVKRQISDLVNHIADSRLVQHLVFAYEPIWAIGTGLNATPQQIQAIHSIKRQALKQSTDENIAQSLQILYGGSVKPGNAEAILEQPDINGCLVGGASLDAEKFIQICHACLQPRIANFVNDFNLE